MSVESEQQYSAYTVRDLLKIGMSKLKAGKIEDASTMFMEVCERFTRAGEGVPATALSL